MKKLLLIISIGFMFHTCKKQVKTTSSVFEYSKISCTNSECYGIYTGQEFIKGSDIAHQFSNKMSGIVGDKLKELYKLKEYSKVDLNNIKMTTKGMGVAMLNIIYLFQLSKLIQSVKHTHHSIMLEGGITNLH